MIPLFVLWPAPMPGYPFDEVMAAGSFTQGSTIELSADAPVVEPYTLYMQGGLSIRIWKTFYPSCTNKYEKQLRCQVHLFSFQTILQSIKNKSGQLPLNIGI